MQPLEEPIPAWPRVLLSAPLVRSCVLRWLGWDVASIERVSALEAHQRDVLYVEVVELGSSSGGGSGDCFHQSGSGSTSGCTGGNGSKPK